MPIDEAKVRRIKEIAAQRAFEVYAKTMQEELPKIGIDDIGEAVDQTTHIHEAILMTDNGKPVLVHCRWDFSSHPARVREALQRTKPAGSA